MKALLLLSPLLLVGCMATVPVEKDRIPVPVPCKVEMPTKPEQRYAPPYDNIFDAVRDLLVDRELAESYQKELQVALQSCR